MSSLRVTIILEMLLVFLLLSITSCTEFNYGIKHDPVNFIDEQVYNKRNDIEFETTLFYDEKNSKPFIIQVEHNLIGSKLISEVQIVDWYPEQDKIFDIGKIMISLESNGNRIDNEIQYIIDDKKYTESTSGNLIFFSNKVERNKLTIKSITNLEKKHQTINENIILEFEINGDQVVIKKTLPLIYEIESTFPESIKNIINAF